MKIRVPPRQDDGQDGDSGPQWLANDFTKRLAESTQRDAAEALNRLVSASKASTDPKIVAHVAEYLHYKAVGDLLAGRWEKDK